VKRWIWLIEGLGGDGFGAFNSDDALMIAITPFSFGIDGDSGKLQLTKCR